MNDKNIIKFLKDRNIDIVIKKNKKNNEKDDIEVKTNNHLNILKEFHEISMNSNEFYSLALTSSIWHEIEELKVWNKRAKNIINSKDIRINYIKKAEKCINEIYEIDYSSLIKRAMKRKELCIGKPYESNLWKEFNLKISDISRLNFNMIEIDYYKYLSRLKKKNNTLYWNDIIENIIITEKLDNKSYMFLKALLNYPYEEMKSLQKEYLNNIKKIYMKI
ncbi:hypothetical protein [Clostridium tarantellae]|uniref:Spore coat protein n=1 Tax=Clostridium tarantellae TaxID=39493 RepID=A0A6I1MJW6_9CLOT|nr:hypothetical protein [Clostridium tarantellae]MPQ43003.1 hypothetical protein [Clostridium tarantellae]